MLTKCFETNGLAILGFARKTDRDPSKTVDKNGKQKVKFYSQLILFIRRRAEHAVWKLNVENFRFEI